MIFDEAALLGGCILLGRRCYQSIAAVLFVSAAITYTAISSTQVWFDLHAYYLIPLILYAALKALETGLPRYLLAAALLSAATVIGNLPYFVPYTAFILCLFCSIYFAFGAAHCRGVLMNWWSGSRRQLPLLLLPAAFMAGTLLIYPLSTATMAIDHPGRGSDGSVASLNSFLTYGGLNTFWKYWDLSLIHISSFSPDSGTADQSDSRSLSDLEAKRPGRTRGRISPVHPVCRIGAGRWSGHIPDSGFSGRRPGHSNLCLLYTSRCV